METTWPKVCHSALRPTKTKFNEKKSEDGIIGPVIFHQHFNSVPFLIV